MSENGVETNSPSGEDGSGGLRVQEMQADGHCFFKAISFGLYGTEDKFGHVKDSVLEYVSKNWEEYQFFIIGDESYMPAVNNLEDYKNQFKNDIILGGDVELAAAAASLSIFITVRHSLQDNDVSFGSRENKRVSLLYKPDGDHGHYDVILENTVLDKL